MRQPLCGDERRELRRLLTRLEGTTQHAGSRRRTDNEVRHFPPYANIIMIIVQ